MKSFTKVTNKIKAKVKIYQPILKADILNKNLVFWFTVKICVVETKLITSSWPTTVIVCPYKAALVYEKGEYPLDLSYKILN